MLTKTHKAITLTLIAAALTACQSTTTTTSNNNSPNINEVAQQQYNGPKARVAVARFTDKSNDSRWWRKEIGEGMADQLTTALVSTNRFIVLERQCCFIRARLSGIRSSKCSIRCSLRRNRGCRNCGCSSGHRVR